MFSTEIDPLLGWVLRLCTGLLFVSAGYHKLRDPTAFRQVVGHYALLPQRLVPAVAASLPVAELALAAGLVLPELLGIDSIGQVTRGAALGVVGLLGLYTAAMLANLARGRTGMDCGCGSSGVHRPIGMGLLARNGFLLVAAALCVLPADGRALTWLDGVVVLPCVISCALLYAALEMAAANAKHQKRLFVSRIAPSAMREGV
jgi:uncharacterized membrane protein YphA (DoxX/SURF4 family)